MLAGEGIFAIIYLLFQLEDCLVTRLLLLIGIVLFVVLSGSVSTSASADVQPQLAAYLLRDT